MLMDCGQAEPPGGVRLWLSSSGCMWQHRPTPACWYVPLDQTRLTLFHHMGLLALKEGAMCHQDGVGRLRASTWGFQNSSREPHVEAQSQLGLAWWHPLLAAVPEAACGGANLASLMVHGKGDAGNRTPSGQVGLLPRDFPLECWKHRTCPAQWHATPACSAASPMGWHGASLVYFEGVHQWAGPAPHCYLQPLGLSWSCMLPGGSACHSA